MAIRNISLCFLALCHHVVDLHIKRSTVWCFSRVGHVLVGYARPQHANSFEQRRRSCRALQHLMHQKHLLVDRKGSITCAVVPVKNRRKHLGWSALVIFILWWRHSKRPKQYVLGSSKLSLRSPANATGGLTGVGRYWSWCWSLGQCFREVWKPAFPGKTDTQHCLDTLIRYSLSLTLWQRTLTPLLCSRPGCKLKGCVEILDLSLWRDVR